MSSVSCGDYCLHLPHNLRRMYIHQLKQWPNFVWDMEEISPRLTEVRFKQGKLLGYMEHLGFELQSEAVLQILTKDPSGGRSTSYSFVV